MDKLTEERLQVLRMIQQKKITAEQGAKLLAALKVSAARSAEPGGTTGAPPTSKWFRVRVTDVRTGKRKVNLNIPVGLVDVGIKLGARFVMGGVDMDDVIRSVKAGAEGKLIDVENAQTGERVEIYVD